jgi:hypothetical protein
MAGCSGSRPEVVTRLAGTLDRFTTMLKRRGRIAAPTACSSRLQTSAQTHPTGFGEVDVNDAPFRAALAGMLAPAVSWTVPRSAPARPVRSPSEEQAYTVPTPIGTPPTTRADYPASSSSAYKARPVTGVLADAGTIAALLACPY